MDYAKAQIELVTDMLKQEYPVVYSMDVDEDRCFLTADAIHGYVFSKNEIVIKPECLKRSNFENLKFKEVYDRGILLEATGDFRKVGKRTAVVYKSLYGDEIHLDKSFLKHFKGCDFLYTGGKKHNAGHAVCVYEMGKPVGLVLPLRGGSIE